MAVTRNDLGDNCHFKNSNIPVAVVTNLKGDIIFGNYLDDPSDVNNIKSVWAVSGVRVMLTRFWAASTAYIVLTAHSLLGLPSFLKDKAGAERELCIWVGYLNTFRNVKQSDLGTSLIRVFVGVVDTVTGTSSGTGGTTISIQMRDRMKWLMDTTVTYNPAVDEGSGEAPLRSNFIFNVVQRGIGQVESKEKNCAVCGKKFLWDKEYNYDLGDNKTLNKQSNNSPSVDGAANVKETNNPDVSNIPPADVWYKAGLLSGKTTTEKLSVEPNPYLRVYTTRAPIDLKRGGNLLVSQQVPIDILKFASQQECYPTEVFQDSRDGNIYYCPRANDASSLEDPKRFYRTYFCEVIPSSLKVNNTEITSPEPDYNQILIAFKEESSSINVKTNIYVSKNAPLSQNGAHDDISIHLQVRPKFLKGVEYACKFARASDDTITTAEEAAVVALHAARILGKEVRAATAVLIGDPSFVPGEILQIIGSPLLEERGIKLADDDRKTFTEFNNRYSENLKTYATEALKNAGSNAPAIEGAEVTLPVYDGSTATIKIEKSEQENQDTLICEVGSSISEGKDDPQTIWRVEAVLLKLNIGTKGFQTELSLISPF
jgi:hypothetical protein